MRILRTIAEMRQCRSTSGRLGLVPTMGAIHEGHLSLVRAARTQCETVTASIFVNPLQFGPNEDLAKYPRTFEEDCRKLEAEGVDLLFAPSNEEMYPNGAVTIVEVQGISDRLDGIARPGHFRGVATVVAKLFHIVQPDLAFFGQKDAAQLAVLRTMVRELNFPVEMVVCPTVREIDGLAMSSRNRYLTADDRTLALTLVRALRAACATANSGVTDASQLQQSMLDVLEVADGIALEYAEVVDPMTLLPLTDTLHGALLAVAAQVGTTRLIDNMLIEGRSR